MSLVVVQISNVMKIIFSRLRLEKGMMLLMTYILQYNILIVCN
jgi:hypothetical protein